MAIEELTCHQCGFPIPWLLKVCSVHPTYINVLIRSLSNLIKGNTEECIIFACIALESFLAAILKYNLKQLETDPRVIECFLDDNKPHLALYASYLHKLNIGVEKKEIDSLRELYDMRNTIIHKAQMSFTSKEIESALIKLANFMIKYSQYYPKQYGRCDLDLNDEILNYFI